MAVLMAHTQLVRFQAHWGYVDMCQGSVGGQPSTDTSRQHQNTPFRDRQHWRGYYSRCWRARRGATWSRWRCRPF